MKIKSINLSQYSRFLAPRPKDSHKGDSGHVLIVGGELGFSGAPRMAGEAALRVGAGLVSIATRPDHAALMNLARPELMCHGISSAKTLLPLLQRADVVVIGPGLGLSPWAKQLLEVVLKTDLPLIVDADALNLLAVNPTKRDNWILTPHPGEAARLLKTTTAIIQKERVSAIQQLQKKFAGMIVLKGSGTLILSTNPYVSRCTAGNPGMASAGMGDVLSGVLGGLVAQGIPLDVAAQLGVVLHASAGDLAAREGERGTLAMDLMPHLRTLVNPKQKKIK